MCTNNTHEVAYFLYCLKCKYRDLEEQKDPCHDCLNQGYNWNSRKPIHFEEADMNAGSKS